jgi:NifU-like protein
MEKLGDIKYICECLKITELEMKQAISENNLKTFEEVTDYFRTTWACGDCFNNIKATIDEIEQADYEENN